MNEPDPKQMTFLEHIGELRGTLIRSLAAVTVLFIASLFFVKPLMEWLKAPLIASYPPGDTAVMILRTHSVSESFTILIKLGFAVSLAAAAPYILYELWKFVAPGLNRAERLAVLPILLFGTALFAVGAWFAYEIVLPYALQYFIALNEHLGLVAEWNLGEYYSFVISLLLVFGGVFEVPLIAAALGKMGIISARNMVIHGRHAVVIIFIAAAVLTPPDVFTQILLAAPLLILYGVSILLVKLVEPK